MGNTVIGRRLKLARIAADLSRAELAQRGFVSIQAVSAWERGDAVPRLDTACRVSDVLGISLDWLAGRETKPQSKNYLCKNNCEEKQWQTQRNLTQGKSM